MDEFMSEHAMKQKVKQMMHTFQQQAQAVYLTTIDEAGFPHARAMVNVRNGAEFPRAVTLFAGHEHDFMTFFSTVRGLGKLSHIDRNPKVSAFYCHPREWRSLLLKGTIERVQDEVIQEKIWHADWLDIFPEGTLDPRQVILRLIPNYALGLCYIDHKRYVMELL
jgi:general stress protein 26